MGLGPDLVPMDGPDAWHPMDLLIALLHDDEGVLRGTMSIDMPKDGRRPGEAQRAVLQKYAEQAGRAVVTALEREALAAQVRLADAARKIVRTASAQLSLARILEDSREALVEGFQAHGMWIQTFDQDGLGTGTIHAADGSTIELPRTSSRSPSGPPAGRGRCSEVEVVATGDRSAPRSPPSRASRSVASWRGSASGRSCSCRSGAGPECLGNLVLTRTSRADDWTEVETTVALDIGHDLGRASSTPGPSSASTGWSRSCRPSTPTRAS